MSGNGVSDRVHVGSGAQEYVKQDAELTASKESPGDDAAFDEVLFGTRITVGMLQGCSTSRSRHHRNKETVLHELLARIGSSLR